MAALASTELTGWKELDAAFRQAPDIVRDEMFRALVEADQLLEREVKDRMPTATGVSRQSVFSREQPLEGGALGVVGTALPHVAYVELGTRPHFPPVEALEDWVRVKLAVPEDRVHDVAFLIARKIAKTGTKGAFMFRDAWAGQEAAVVGLFEAALGRVAARLGKAH